MSRGTGVAVYVGVLVGGTGVGEFVGLGVWVGVGVLVGGADVGVGVAVGCGVWVRTTYTLACTVASMLGAGVAVCMGTAVGCNASTVACNLSISTVACTLAATVASKSGVADVDGLAACLQASNAISPTATNGNIKRMRTSFISANLPYDTIIV